MFDHVKFGVRDYAASLDFYLKTLEPLGVSVVDHGAHGVLQLLRHLQHVIRLLRRA